MRPRGAGVATAPAVAVGTQQRLAAVVRITVAVGGALLTLCVRAEPHHALAPDALLGGTFAEAKPVACVEFGARVSIVAGRAGGLRLEVAHASAADPLGQEAGGVVDQAVRRPVAGPQVGREAGVLIPLPPLAAVVPA